jgi:hypothetical protein
MFTRQKLILLTVLMLVAHSFALAQSMHKNTYFWKLQSFSGEARLEGLYREQERIGKDINELQKSAYLTGGAFIKTSSSFLNDNFLLLDLEAGYMPETRRDNFLVIPDQSEVRDIKKLDLTASFFRQKNLNLILFANFDESYAARENLTDVKSINRHYGGSFSYTNKILPFNIDYHQRNWDETELQTGRHYTFDQSIFSARASKSFTRHDRNEFRYSHDDNVNVNQNLFRVANTIDNLEFDSHITFDRKQNISLNTRLLEFIQNGNTTLKRFQYSEMLNARLPGHLTFQSSYNLCKVKQPESELLQHSVFSSLEHNLYRSLTSRINFEYNNISHTVYREVSTKPGVEFNYSKQIPGGQLLVNYRYDRYHQDYTSDPSNILITDEPYSISDTRIVLLRLPDIQVQSILVKDATGTMFYQEGFDYILIQRDRYIEIRRIPGGTIAENGTVLITYTAVQPGSYKYDANTHALNASVYLFHNLLSVYYRFSTQDYTNLETAEFVTLNYFTQNLVGARLDFGFVSGGAEYENYQSSILPYRMMKYFVNFQKNFGSHFTGMLNGTLQDYTMLENTEPEYQKYLDVNGKLTYHMVRNTDVNLDLMYRKQTGRGIDLDLLMGKAEVVSAFNRLFVSVGVEVYRRNYVGEQINFKGAYAKLVRKF